MKNTKLFLFLKLVIAIVTDFVRAKDDGRISRFEALLIIFTHLKEVFQTFKEIPDIFQEFLLISDENRFMMIEEFRIQFKLPNDKIEKIIEGAFNLLNAITCFINAFKK